MSIRWSAWAVVVALAAAGCGESAPPAQRNGAPLAASPDQEPPVALNPDSPIQYPPRLFDQKVEGDVVLRLFVDSTGRLAPESSKVAESSGYPALDSAALAGGRKLRFAPARRRGLPVATAFLQPIEFRHPGAAGAVIKGRPDTTKVTVTRARPDTTRRPRVQRDTTVAQPDSGVILPDTIPAKADTGARADTGAARADTSAPTR